MLFSIVHGKKTPYDFNGWGILDRDTKMIKVLYAFFHCPR